MVKRSRTGIALIILIVIVLILLGFIGYAFVIAPSFNGFVVNKQVEGYNAGVNDAVLTVIQQAVTCQQVPLTYNNQTINIIAVECLSQQG